MTGPAGFAARAALSVALALVVWQGVVLLGLANERYFPGLDRIAAAAAGMIASGELPSAAALTFGRAVMGLTAATALGLGLALASESAPWFRLGFRRVAAAIQPIPPAAIVPMCVFALGLGWELYAFIIILVTVWPVFLNAAAALHAVGEVQINAARMLGFGPREILWRIKLPAAMPEIFAGIRYAATSAILATIVSEMLAGRDGLGFLLFKKAFAIRIPDVYALMFACMALGLCVNGGLNLMRRLTVGWSLGQMERPT